VFCCQTAITKTKIGLHGSATHLSAILFTYKIW
jgi:hypothetical protein